MPWDVRYYRAVDDSVPAFDFLLACPTAVRATMLAVLDAVAAAPPPRFSGGGLWEAMHGAMHGYYEVRKGGSPNRTQYRPFCLLENPADGSELRRRGLSQPAIVVVTGLMKPWMTTLSAADYSAVRALGSDHLAQLPRRIAE
jgi:hypothetical protein